MEVAEKIKNLALHNLVAHLDLDYVQIKHAKNSESIAIMKNISFVLQKKCSNAKTKAVQLDLKNVQLESLVQIH